MPSNIEIKARLRDFDETRRRAESLTRQPVETILQEDVFFNTPAGRLKLRSLSPNQGQLIYYTRPDQGGPKRSDYHISHTADPGGLRRVLELAWGVRGIVRKRRLLYLVGQTRIHLDEVEGLGQFLELEVVLQDGQPEADGQAIAESLMRSLGVEQSDLLAGAYMDLLEAPSRPVGPA